MTTAYRWPRRSLLSLPISVACLCLGAVAGQAQEINVPGLEPATEITNPNELRPLAQASSLLSLEGGRRLVNEASTAIAAQDYSLATTKLQEARQVYNQISNFYQQLAASFSGIDNRISASQRQKALDTAQLRDEATYQLALVHRARNQPELAIPLLIQIIRSQQPTRDLGTRAYQQLFELGFVDQPFPRPAEGEVAPSRPQPQSTNLLSLEGGQQLMTEATSAIAAQNYGLAITKLQEARQVYNQLSNFYQDLAASFTGIDNTIASTNRQRALDAAQLRDEATYQLALVHRAQNQPELAVPLLVQIIGSQQPTRDLGKRAYQQLFELGFADTTFPRARQ
ncbi:hypothetical protein OOK60_15000 [Trichothermofontia sichuanensis B231]|uniref:hypothetical protein n=1 Tax=Trichothermofontia sichuanensis TaxID=3045816 RepID=UPI0022486711|nr:hypothetical protein OOK60_15000 [Trichothermofontia sichuanensis B231]